MRNLKWSENEFLILKLLDNTYTVARMLDHPVMHFFNIVRDRDEWGGVEFSALEPLFRAYIGGVVIKELAIRKVPGKEDADFLRGGLWIKPHVSYDGGFPFRGGKLVDCGEAKGLSPLHAPVLKENLVLPADREFIEICELTNMWGRDDLSDRLCRYFKTGINRDDLKFEVFPGLWSDREDIRPLTRRLPLPFR